MKKLYFLLAAMLFSFAANAETLTVEIAQEDDDYNQTSGDDFTVEATIGDGTCTIEDFLGSGKSITFTAYDDGSATIDWPDNTNTTGSFTFSNFGTYTSLYIAVESGYTYVNYYDEGEDGKYFYFGVYAGSSYDWYDLYIDLPDSFQPKESPKVYYGTLNVNIYELDADGNESATPIVEEIGYQMTGTDVIAFTSLFGRTDMSTYLKFTINRTDNSVTGAMNAGFYTKFDTDQWSFQGTTYQRFYDTTREFDAEKNEFVWTIGFSYVNSSTRVESGKTSDYKLHFPITDAAGVKNVVVDSDSDAPVEYFNLQGVRVANPENGLYIRRQGKTATKVIIR